MHLLDTKIVLRRSATLVAIAALAAIGIAGCGGDNNVPPDAVANVNGTIITQKQFNDMLEVRARGQAAQTGSKKKNPVPKPGTPEYNALKDAVMQSILTETWNDLEAKDLGIDIGDAEVRQRFETEKKQFFPKEKDYKKFLKQTGQSEAQVLVRVKAALIAQQVQQRLAKQQEKITILQVADYYNKNKKQFTTPEQRDLLVIVNTSKKKIDAAKQALDKGEDFAKVAKKYSSDQGSKARGGQVTVPKGLTDKTLDAQIFGAKIGELAGPTKIASGGWLLFKVKDQKPASTQPLDKVKAQISQTLTSQGQQKVLTDFQSKWKKRTNCAKDFRVQLCSNAPPQPKAPAGLPPGAAPPQQGGQQQAPPPQQGGQQQAPPPSQSRGGK